MTTTAAYPGGDLYIVDDDASTRDALSVIFTLAGYRVKSFADGESFLAVARHRPPVCVMLDVHMPRRSGIDILKALNARTYRAPVFIVSGDGDVALAVQAIKNGAHDYILKPFDPQDIIARVRKTVAGRARQLAENRARGLAGNFPGRALLTPRECEVLAAVTAGSSNKEIGRRLGISPRTVEVHRARIMEKLGARNAADLVRIVLAPPDRTELVA
jgi:FixJ family two-component response regulator